MRTEQKKHHLFLLLAICLLLFICFGCGEGGGQAAYSFTDSNSNQNSSPPPIMDLLSNPPPPAPKWISVISSSDQVSLDWSDESPREDGFIVIRDDVEIARTGRNESKYLDNGVSPATTYLYKVVAFNKEGGNISPEQAVTTLSFPPSAPTNLLATADTGGISLAWTDNSSNEDGFRIERNGAGIQTVSANNVSYRDTAVSAGFNYCYQIAAYNLGGRSEASEQICVAINMPPWATITYPQQDELVYRLVRVKAQWSDEDDQYLTIRILLDNAEIMTTEVSASSSMTSSQWFDIDFTNAIDGDHIISLEAYDSHGAKTAFEVKVRVNQAEVDDKAVQFLYLQSTITCDTAYPETYKCIVRWVDPLHVIEVSPLFTQEQFQMIQESAAFLTRYTGIPFEVRWSSIETFGPDPNCYSLPVDINFIFIYPESYPENSYARTCAPRDGSAIPAYTTISRAVIIIQNTTLTQKPETLMFIYAHELAHTLPIINHESALYLMYPSVNRSFRLSPEMARAMEMLYYEFLPGDQIPTPAYFTIGYISSW